MDRAERTELRIFSPTLERSIPPPWRKSRENKRRGAPGISRSEMALPELGNSRGGSRRIAQPESEITNSHRTAARASAARFVGGDDRREEGGGGGGGEFRIWRTVSALSVKRRRGQGLLFWRSVQMDRVRFEFGSIDSVWFGLVWSGSSI